MCTFPITVKQQFGKEVFTTTKNCWKHHFLYSLCHAKIVLAISSNHKLNFTLHLSSHWIYGNKDDDDDDDTAVHL
jgi:hypothetical protein